MDAPPVNSHGSWEPPKNVDGLLPDDGRLHVGMQPSHDVRYSSSSYTTSSSEDSTRSLTTSHTEDLSALKAEANDEYNLPDPPTDGHAKPSK
ncbi:hypothetical protein LTR16_005934, partial [Cryomyces antarcticus]